MLYPFIFHPIFKERVWGGRDLERLYQKPLPPGKPIGESWEISDRPGDVSVIANGPLTGKDLRWLMENHAAELLGKAHAQAGRFPLLIKILDAREKLSLQVHPPAAKAATLGGEPKTEMWYVTAATPGAELYVGLKRGVTRAEFERKINDGSVADCFHRVKVMSGDVMFLPSGRVHALGSGIVLFEIQQNSDTTYRVFDWNRVGLDGRPRELHVRQSLESIDFNDFEPGLVKSAYSSKGALRMRPLVDDALFRVSSCQAGQGERFHLDGDAVQVLGVLRGRLAVGQGATAFTAVAGQFVMLPASVGPTAFVSESDGEFLHVQAR